MENKLFNNIKLETIWKLDEIEICDPIKIKIPIKKGILLTNLLYNKTLAKQHKQQIILSIFAKLNLQNNSIIKIKINNEFYNLKYKIFLKDELINFYKNKKYTFLKEKIHFFEKQNIFICEIKNKGYLTLNKHFEILEYSSNIEGSITKILLFLTYCLKLNIISYNIDLNNNITMFKKLKFNQMSNYLIIGEQNNQPIFLKYKANNKLPYLIPILEGCL